MNSQNSQNDFIDFISLKLINKKISPQEKQILYFFAEVLYEYDDGDLLQLEPPSSMVTLMLSVCGNKYPQAISSSINCFGQKHFCFEDVAEAIEKGYQNYKYYPGFGHPLYKKEDPRVIKCLKFIEAKKYESKFIHQIVEFSNKQKICLNIAGLITAFLMDLGFTKYNISYFPIIIRMIGMTNIYEKAKKNKLKVFSSKAIKEFSKIA